MLYVLNHVSLPLSLANKTNNSNEKMEICWSSTRSGRSVHLNKRHKKKEKYKKNEDLYLLFFQVNDGIRRLDVFQINCGFPVSSPVDWLQRCIAASVFCKLNLCRRARWADSELDLLLATYLSLILPFDVN